MKIRTIGLYQPYASLMLHGKLESRWVQKGKKPPFPLGKYLIYSTKKRYSDAEFNYVAGRMAFEAKTILKDEPTADLCGYAIAVGDLVELILMTPVLEPSAYIDTDLTLWESNAPITVDDHVLWGLRFENVCRIKPFEFRGKQGVGFYDGEIELT
jgi:hypothetical protein